MSALLHYVPDLRRKMLQATQWNTGARINEALALTRGDFSLAPPYPFVQLATLKQRTEKAARTAGRMPAGQQTHRLVPLSDSWYVSQLQTMVATLLYAGIPLKVLQSLMGHKSISSTEVYTKVFALDVAAQHRGQFSMPESDAVTMLKNRHA